MRFPWAVSSADNRGVADGVAYLHQTEMAIVEASSPLLPPYWSSNLTMLSESRASWIQHSFQPPNKSAFVSLFACTSK